MAKKNKLPKSEQDQPANKPPDYDSPWKEAIELFFPEFMKFFFPNIYDKIHWNRSYTFLDKDLEKITRDAKIGRRLADKLAKVWKKDGKAAWVLIHIEVQSERETNFSERIYIYRHRIWEKYKLDVASLVILSDTAPKYRPNQYKKEIWGSKLLYEFPIVKLLDYAVNWEQLKQNPNPFAIVTMAQIKAKTVKNNLERKLWKFQLVKMLYERGYNKSTILELFRFIDWLIQLPDELEQQFSQDLQAWEEETKMRYITSVERFGFENGFEKGMLQGMKKGMAEGKAEGKAEGLTEGKAEGMAKGLAEGKAEGLAEGKEEGRREEKIEIAKTMQQEGFPHQTIAKILELPLEEVEALISDSSNEQRN